MYICIFFTFGFLIYNCFYPFHLRSLGYVNIHNSGFVTVNLVNHCICFFDGNFKTVARLNLSIFPLICLFKELTHVMKFFYIFYKLRNTRI